MAVASDSADGDHPAVLVGHNWEDSSVGGDLLPASASFHCPCKDRDVTGEI